MKSSVMAEVWPKSLPSGSHRIRGSRAPRDSLEGDSGEDQHASRDLEHAQRLREQNQREEHGKERLQVRKERRARRTDAVDRREPENVREEQRADNCVTEAEPHLPAEREAL